MIVYGDGDGAAAPRGAWNAGAAAPSAGPTPGALLDLATFFLHRPFAKLAEAQRERLTECTRWRQALAGRKVLIVDDDMRNIFALSTVLEEHEMVIVSADNGRDAIRMLRDDPSSRSC